MKEYVYTEQYALYYDRLYGVGHVEDKVTGKESLTITGQDMYQLKDLIDKTRECYSYAVFNAETYVSLINTILKSQF
jgi:hypothetical protein